MLRVVQSRAMMIVPSKLYIQLHIMNVALVTIGHTTRLKYVQMSMEPYTIMRAQRVRAIVVKRVMIIVLRLGLELEIMAIIIVSFMIRVTVLSMVH